MPCYKPVLAYQVRTGEVVFSERRSKGDYVRTLELACGQCIGCRLERSRQWAVRMMHEASLYPGNSFVTLTYRDLKAQSLDYRDFQLFMKRLRKEFAPGKVRFFCAGEYGTLGLRPHFHAILFNCFFVDREYWMKSPGGGKLYRSKVLERLWPLGFSSIGDVTFESAAYVARYVVKKVGSSGVVERFHSLDVTTGEVVERAPEFARMSLRPGIGAAWLDRFAGDVSCDGRVVARGVECNAPRFYLKRLQDRDSDEYAEFLQRRDVEARKRFADRSPERLKARETVAKARADFLKRNLKEVSG